MKTKQYDLKDYNDIIDMCFQLFYRVKELEFENERLKKGGKMHVQEQMNIMIDRLEKIENENKELLKGYENGK